MKRNQKGFTLIELMVVIAIIGLLSTIVLVSLAKAKEKARSAYAIQEVRQIQIAMEEYYNDNGTYPYNATCISTSIPTTASTICCIGGSCTWNGTPIPGGQTITLKDAEFTSPQYAAATLSDYLSSYPAADGVTLSGGLYKGFFYYCSKASGGKCLDGALVYSSVGNTGSCAGGTSNYYMSDASSNTLCWRGITDFGATPEI
jgi:prepilin-type N-terminal cleavage/methylation domain-containing protein